ncbi:hypothetical protein LOD99_7345 [Oopsacas minuta]|uniref:Death domain-containing protein n=1 Tax=Oopsacas minuta TaxID=111878 RepID=A0AAV7JWB2_9METZ|nr:hypothetical protein LOD99_7345 [Oopsacas minuta]
METDSYRPNAIFQELQDTINNDKLFIESLRFFAQDLDNVDKDFNVLSILKKVYSSKYVPEGFGEYEFLKFIFDKINRKINSESSQRCVSIMDELLMASPIEQTHELTAPTSEFTAPKSEIAKPKYEVPTTPTLYTTTITSDKPLEDKFMFFKFAKNFPNQDFKMFAVVGLKMSSILYGNEVAVRKNHNDMMDALISWWKQSADGQGDPNKPPNYTKAGLIQALQEADLNDVTRFVQNNC